MREHLDEGGPPTLATTGAHAEIHLHRPDVHNRLEPADVFLLAEMLERLASQSEVRLVTFRAQGASFCSGINLKSIRGDQAAPRAREAVALFMRLPELIEALPQPTLFALNGPLYGGAIDLALAGCFRIGVPATTFSVAAPSRGALYSPDGMVRAVNVLGPAASKRLFMGGRTLEADDLLALGGLDQLVAPEALPGAVDDWARSICALAPLPVRAAKRIINAAALRASDPGAVALMRDEIDRSADLAEGMEAYRQRRPARFEGR